MQKVWKKLAVLVSLCCLALTVGLFAACGNGNDDTTVTYTVTVVAPDGTTPVQGVQIAFCDVECHVAGNTDANGVVTYEGKKGVNYHVQVNKTGNSAYVATGYTPDDSTCYTNDWNGTSYTIQLSDAE